MQFNRITDQISFKIINKELLSELSEVTLSKREIHTDDKLVKDFGQFNSIINKFVRYFSENFSEEQTKQMLNKLNNLEIRVVDEKKKRFATHISLGHYDSINNTITISNYNDKRISFDLERTLIHELLHMASTRYLENDRVITGLEIPELLGVEFNEKYTDYLTDKYFTNSNCLNQNDRMLYVIKGIEILVGKEKLQECYFNANIGELFNELEQYSKKEDILKLFYLIDRIDDPAASHKNFRNIIREIEKINIRKLSILRHAKKITDEEYDIEYARTRELRNYRLWSEDAEIVKDEDSFIFKENNRTSDVYLFNIMNGTHPKFEKKH